MARISTFYLPEPCLYAAGDTGRFMDTIQPYLDYFAANPGWAITFVFLIAFGEALLIIGLFVPSTVALVSAGMLVGTGHLGFWEVFLATAVGAILGDQVSYWAGRWYGERLKTMWPLNRYPALVEKGEDFVRKHGGKSIAIGRFIPGVKAVVPGIVGMLGMNQPFFVFVNTTSGIVWAAAHVFPGILLGQGLALAGDLSGHLVVVLIVLLIVLGLASWLIRIFAATLQPYTRAARLRASNWAKSGKSRSWQRFGRAIAPDNPRAPAVILMLLLGLVSLVFLLDIVFGLVLRDAASNLDVSVSTLMGELRNSPADGLMIPLTMLAERPVIWTLALAVAAWLFAWKGWRVAVLMLGMLLTGELSALLINKLVGPSVTVMHPNFISTPTLMAGLAFGSVAVLASHSMGRWSKSVVAAVCGSLVIAIAFTRVYLGAEWLSGVLAGGLLALVLTSLFGMAIEAIPSRRIRPLGLLAFSTVAFVLAGLFHVNTKITEAEARYAARPAIQTFSEADWSNGAWQKIPNRRIDLAGRPEEVFSAQWIGDVSQLESALTQQGWKQQQTWRWKDAFLYLDPKANLDKLPPRPVLHQGLKAKLTMILDQRAPGQRRLVLRAFKSYTDIALTGSTKPVFLISVTPEVARPRLNLYAMPATLQATDDDRKQASAALSKIANAKLLASSDDPQEPAKVLLAQP
jgi:membrane protein DedA with SNARE-associated domain